MHHISKCVIVLICDAPKKSEKFLSGLYCFGPTYKFGVISKGYHSKVRKCDHQEHFLRLIGETRPLFVTNIQHKPQIFSLEAGGHSENPYSW